MGDNIITYEGGKYYAQNGSNTASKKPLGEWQYASGIIKPTTTTLAVTGLSFAPQSVIVVFSGGGAWGACGIAPTAFNSNGASYRCWQGAGNNFNLGANGFSLTSDGFAVPVGYANYDYTWFAFGK